MPHHQTMPPYSQPQYLEPPQPTKPRHPRSRSSSSPPFYPLPIPENKIKEAVELYKAYVLADHLAESSNAIQGIGSTGRSRARSNAASSADGHTATSMSTTGELVHFTAGMSFAQSPASPTAGGAVSHTGNFVKVRKRSALSPKSRAKAALIRHLGACCVCHKRRVKCPLEHHDIAKLEELYNARNDTSSHTSISGSTPNSSGLLPPANQSVAGGSQSLAYSLRGIDERREPQYPPDLDLELQSPVGPTLPQRPSVRTVEDDSTSSSIIFQINNDPYAWTLDREHFALGVFSQFVDANGSQIGRYKCEYLGRCDEHFNDTEELQCHFERAHFAYLRNTPPRRYICSKCNALNSGYAGPLATQVCTNCHIQGSIQLWIHGRFVKNLYYQQYPPDQQGVGRMSPQDSFGSQSDGSFSMQQPGPGSDEHMNPGTNQGGYYYHNGNNDVGPAYLGPSAGGYEHNPPFYYQNYGLPRNGFRAAQQLPTKLNLIHGSQSKTLGRLSLRKFVGLFLALLLAILFGLETFSWVSVNAHNMFRSLLALEDHLPTLGFIVILASSVSCWCLKLIAVPRVRRGRRASCKSRCPLHDIPQVTVGLLWQADSSTADTYAYGGEYS